MKRVILDLEGLVAFVFIVVYYFSKYGDLSLFLLLLLVPDIVALAYLIRADIGKVSYNLVHNYVVPSILFFAGWQLQHDELMKISLIWLAHVAMDRMFGFGLK
jgi:hypothetical protein